MDALSRQVHQSMLPNRPQGVAFIHEQRFSHALQVPAERVAVEFGITTEQAIEELRRLLTIKAYTADTRATEISPTPLMDELWHALILDTRLYADLQAALGLILHHRPDGANDEDAPNRQWRLTNMKTLYQMFFGSRPLGEPPIAPIHLAMGGPFLNPIHILVKTLEGETLEVLVGNESTVEQVKHLIHESGGLPVNMQRLIFVGQQLENGRTMGDYSIQDNTTLHLVSRLAGC